MPIRKDIFLNTSTQFDKGFDGYPQSTTNEDRRRMVKHFMMNQSMEWTDVLKTFFGNLFNLGRYTLYNILSAPLRFINKISVNYAFLNKRTRKKFITIAGLTNVVGIAAITFTKGFGFSFGWTAPVLAAVTYGGLYILEFKPDKVKEISSKIKAFTKDTNTSKSVTINANIEKDDITKTVTITTPPTPQPANNLHQTEMDLAAIMEEVDLAETLSAVSLDITPAELADEDDEQILAMLNSKSDDEPLDFGVEEKEAEPGEASPEGREAPEQTITLKTTKLPTEFNNTIMMDRALQTSKQKVHVEQDNSVPEDISSINLDSFN